MVCQKSQKNAAASIALGCICHIMSRGIPIDRGIFHCAQKMKLSRSSYDINGTVVDFLHVKVAWLPSKISTVPEKNFTQADFLPLEIPLSGHVRSQPAPQFSHQSAFCTSLQNSLFFSGKQHHLALAGGAERAQVRKTRCI